MSSEKIQRERELFEQYKKQRAPGVNLQRIGAEYVDLDVQWHFETWLARANMFQPAAPVVQHSDDAAVDRFAAAMKEKLAAARAKGRAGWDDPNVCPVETLAKLLISHLRKGDAGTFEDVANFAMMLHQRGADPRVLAEAAPVVQAEPVGEIVHWSNGGRTLKFVRMDFEAYPAGTEIYVAPPAIPAQPDASVLVEALKDLLPNLDEALEDLELFGLHSDQGYRKLKDWYRKMLAATKAIDDTLPGKGAAL